MKKVSFSTFAIVFVAFLVIVAADALTANNGVVLAISGAALMGTSFALTRTRRIDSKKFCQWTMHMGIILVLVGILRIAISVAINT